MKPGPRSKLSPVGWLLVGIAVFTLTACMGYLWLSIDQGFTPIQTVQPSD